MDRPTTIVSGILLSLFLLGQSGSEPPKENNNINTIDTIDYSKTRGFDYPKQIYRTIPTDDQVRQMREDNPELIIKVPGRIIKSRKDMTNEQIEEYIEDNLEEILDRYED
jgi:hypothetical protein